MITGLAIWSYKIVYEVTEKDVIILDVFHTSRDPQNLLEIKRELPHRKIPGIGAKRKSLMQLKGQHTIRKRGVGRLAGQAVIVSQQKKHAKPSGTCF